MNAPLNSSIRNKGWPSSARVLNCGRTQGEDRQFWIEDVIQRTAVTDERNRREARLDPRVDASARSRACLTHVRDRAPAPFQTAANPAHWCAHRRHGDMGRDFSSRAVPSRTPAAMLLRDPCQRRRPAVRARRCRERRSRISEVGENDSTSVRSNRASESQHAEGVGAGLASVPLPISGTGCCGARHPVAKPASRIRVPAHIPSRPGVDINMTASVDPRCRHPVRAVASAGAGLELGRARLPIWRWPTRRAGLQTVTPRSKSECAKVTGTASTSPEPGQIADFAQAAMRPSRLKS